MFPLDNNSIPPLAERLRERIQREGSISFRDWMQAALYDERDGYYCRPNRIRQGRAGDYRTAPETSILFAATFARYFAKLYVELGSPECFTILEKGAGTGEFACGVLMTLQRKYPEVFRATQYIIDEVGDGSRAEAAAKLSAFSERVSVRSPAVRESNPESPSNLALPESQASGTITGIVFSNELIDAFPVHRVTKHNGNIRELCVAADGKRFVWAECDPGAQLKAYIERIDLQLMEKQIAEINLEAEKFVSAAAALIETGFLITVDYGAERRELLDFPERRLGTLRAFHRHQLIDDVLAHPGEMDLTTTLDWTQLKEAGDRSGLHTVRHEALDKFLLAEGVLAELEGLAGTASDSAALRLRTGAREMIMPYGMAASFQVLVQEKIANHTNL